MKKFLFIGLIALMVLFCIIPNTSAEEFADDVISGQWVLKSDYTFDGFVSEPVDFLMIHKTDTEDIVSGVGFTKSGQNNIYVQYYDSTGTITVANLYFFSDYVFDFSDAKCDSSFVHWFYSNFMPYSQECDGSACSVADFNTDGVCDTCGNTLAFSVQRSYTPDNYPSNFPSMPVGFGSESQYVIYTDPLGKTEMYTFTPYDNQTGGFYDTIGNPYGSIKVEYWLDENTGAAVKVNRYELYNGAWYYIDGTTSQSTIFASWEGDYTMLYSSLTLFDGYGNLFFPRPLWAMVGEIAQGATAQQIQKTHQILKTLTVCGVSLLACLIGLNLFSKVLLPYLKR